MEYDTQLRLLLLGDGGAGKSSLLTRFTDDTFVPTVSTVGVDFRTKLITLMWQRVRLQLWDTNGQERGSAASRDHITGVRMEWLWCLTRAMPFPSEMSLDGLLTSGSTKLWRTS